MGDLSEHFDRSELRIACPCGCGQDTVDVELIMILETIRKRFGCPVYVNSLNRCIAYNRTKDSKDTSQHIKSKAADIRVERVSPEAVYNFLINKFPNKYGFGKYRTFIHVDCRPEKSRW